MTTEEMVVIHRELMNKYGEDVAQESICQYLATPEVRKPDHFIRLVAHHLFIDEIRRRNRLAIDLPDLPSFPGQVEWARCMEAHDRYPRKVEACVLENRPPSTVRRYRLELRRME